jgi:stress response protein SCP2
MSVTLTKGQSVDLSKQAADAGNAGEVKFQAGAGWDPKSGTAVDLDLMAILIGTDGKALPDENSNGTNLDEAVVFYNNRTLPGFQLSADDRTGQSSAGGDDETMDIDTTKIDTKVQKVMIAIGSYSGQTFAEVENAYGRLVDSKGNELAKVNLGDHGTSKAVVVGELERDGSNWKFTNAVEDLQTIDGLMSKFGVQTA